MHEERDAGADDLPATDGKWRRRDILGWGLSSGLGIAAGPAAAAELTAPIRQDVAQLVPGTANGAPKIGMLVYDDMILMDMNGLESAGRALADDVRSRRAPLIDAARWLAMDAARTIGIPG